MDRIICCKLLEARKSLCLIELNYNLKNKFYWLKTKKRKNCPKNKKFSKIFTLKKNKEKKAFNRAF